MRTRSGLEKAAPPAIDLPVRSPPRPPPIARSITNPRGILKRTPGDNPGAQSTPTTTSATDRIEPWEALQLATAMAEPTTAGSISDSATRPLTPPTEPPPTSETIVDIDDITFDNLPRSSSRPHRSSKPTAKVLGTSVVGGMESGGGERQRPPLPKKSKSSAATIATLKRITGKPIRGDIETAAQSIIDEATRPRASRRSRAQVEPDILLPPRVFDYSMYRNCYWGDTREPFDAKPCKDIFTFSYEEWLTETISYWSGQPAFARFDLQPRTAIIELSTHQKGFKLVKLTVAIESDWNLVIEAIDKWKEDGCWSGRIDLKQRIDKVLKQREVIAPTNPQNLVNTIIKNDPDDDLIFIESRSTNIAPASPAYTATQLKALAKGTKTEKKLRDEKLLEEVDDLNKHYVNRIVKENTCPRASCADNGMPCVVIGDQHVKLVHTEVAAWSKKIGQQKATVTRPHDSLMETLTLRATKMADKEKAKKKPKNKSSDDSDDSRERGRSSKRRRRRSRDSSRSKGNPMQETIAMILALQNSSHSSAAAVSRPAAPPQDHPSSPVRVPERARLTLQGYVAYLRNLEPSIGPRWDSVEEILNDQDISLQQLTKISTTKLEEMGLSVGMALRIKDNLKRFISKESRHGSSSSDDSRPGTASR
jgi:hypothetical protein